MCSPVQSAHSPVHQAIPFPTYCDLDPKLIPQSIWILSLGLNNETLVNLQIDLYIKAYCTKNLVQIQELYSENSDLIVNTRVDHECLMIVNWQPAPSNQPFAEISTHQLTMSTINGGVHASVLPVSHSTSKTSERMKELFWGRMNFSEAELEIILSEVEL